MTDNIQPFEYIKSKNIDEHNQIVDKVNEIVDTINTLDIEGIPTLESDVTALKADVGQLKISDAENVADIAQAQQDISAHASEISAIKDKDVQQDGKIKSVETDITNIKANVLSNTNAITNINAKDAEQDGRITENGKTIDALTKELPTEITLYRDGTGKIRAQVEKEDSTTFDSNTLDMIIPYQYDIVSGTTNRSFKLKVTFSDGSSATTNDFVIPEGGGTDVTVTGITLSKDASNSNKFKASIILSDSTTIDSGYLEMITAVSATFSNKKLTIKVNGVESVPITIDTGITYTGGNGITITGGTISIDSTVVALKSDIPDVSGFATKTELNAVKNDIPDVSGFATKSELNAVDNKVATKADSSTVQQIQTAVGDCFNEVSIDGNVLTLIATDGQSNSVTLPSGATLTKIDLSTWASDWRVGDIALVSIKMSCSGGTASSWTSPLSSVSISKTAAKSGYVCVPITADGTPGYVPFHMVSDSKYIEVGVITYIESASKWNIGSQIIRVNWSRFNGANRVGTQIDLTVGDNASDYIYEIYRLRA